MRNLLILLFFPFAASSQPVFFEKVFGTGGNDLARSVKQLPDGSIYVLGFSDSGNYGGIDAALSKLDRYGNLKWTKYYGNAFDNYGLWLNTTSDGNLIFCGEIQSGNGTMIDAYSTKVDTAGTIIWTKTYSTPVDESFKYVEQTSDGGYILCGFQNDLFGYNDTYVMKTDQLGDSVWAVTIGGADNDYSDAVHQLPDGNYLVTGDSKSEGLGGYDVELTKLDPNGQQLWDFPYGDIYNNGCQGIFLNSSGKYISFGETMIFNNSPFDFYFEQIDTSGTSQSRITFGGSNADAIFSIVEMPDKGYMFTGYSNSYNAGPLNLVVARTDSLFAMQWLRTYGGSGIDIGYEIIHAIDGGVLITGTTNDSITSDSQYYLLHLDDAGLLSDTHDTAASLNMTLAVYPNPSSGDLNIYCENMGRGAFVTIYSSAGNLVYHNNLIAKNNRISLEGFPGSGIYFAEVFDGKNMHHCKISVIKDK